MPLLALPVLLLTALLAAAPPASAAPLPAPPQLSANSYLLVDHVSGKTLAAKEADLRVEPASLTKIMTAYLVAAELERGSVTLDEPVIISAEAQAMPGSRMFVEAGKTVPLGELLRGLIIQSGNDASVALAEHVAASERGFVDMMNRMGDNLGMTGTSYANASGLPHPDHYTTANDLALVARAMIRDFPDVYALYAEREFTYNDIRQRNRNTLLWRDASVDGMKTGHTEAAGYCLVSSAVRDGMRPDQHRARHRERQDAHRREPAPPELRLPLLPHRAHLRRRRIDQRGARLDGARGVRSTRRRRGSLADAAARRLRRAREPHRGRRLHPRPDAHRRGARAERPVGRRRGPCTRCRSSPCKRSTRAASSCA